MGIGGTAKKLQKVVEMGEELYTRINDLRTQVTEMRETVNATHDRVDRLENEVAEQRAILEALATAEGVDIDAVVAEAHITEAESAPSDEPDDETGESAAAATTDADDSDRTTTETDTDTDADSDADRTAAGN